jgi:glutamate formiminotransferase
MTGTWQSEPVLECVANISEGRNSHLLESLVDVCGEDLLDLHVDPDHHRSVFTLVGDTAIRHLARRAIETLDLGGHTDGVHPRLGVVDVVPFVPLSGSNVVDALSARQAFAEWAADELSVPCYLYGPGGGSLASDRTLPDIRRHAWRSLQPDLGPASPHRTAGAICVGVRSILIAYNIWMSDSSGGEAVRHIARNMRSETVRALALRVGTAFQVSMNLIEPERTGPHDVFRKVMEMSSGTTAQFERCELVGLIPRSILERTSPDMWGVLDLTPERTIEHRIDQAVATPRFD